MTNTSKPDCPNCNKSGLAILPVRYAVVPLEANATLPEPLGNKVKNVKLAHHKYALRILRQGFLYLFYEKHARGSHIKWEIYAVSAAGTVWKQYSLDAIHSVSKEPACSITGHNIPTSVIVIQKPEKCGKVWIAFSEHIWSDNTFKSFASNVSLRNERMQMLVPALWIKDKSYQHALEGTQANVEKVIEYQSDFNTATLTGGALTEISSVDGKHDSYVLRKQTTRYSLHLRKSQSKQLVEAMKIMGTQSAGECYPPAVVALWDAVGITHELNGFRNDAVGWIKKYGVERELEIAALNAIEGLKKILETRAVENEKALQKNSITNAPQISPTSDRRVAAAKLLEPRRTQELEVCNILDGWAQRKLPSTLGHAARLNFVNTMAEPRRSAEIARIKNDADAFLVRRAENSPKQIAKAKEMAWPEYESVFEKNAYQNFKRQYEAFLDEADNLIDDRTDDLIKWLESESLLNGFVEFHPNTVDDGVIFDDQVGIAIHGINSSAKGLAKIDAWVKEMKATKSNLIWRAIALNQEEGVAQVNGAMAEAATTATVGQLSIDFLTKYVRKMADIYKKANTMENTLAKAGDAAERIKLVKVTDFDRLFMTVGDRLFHPFLQRGVDTGAEFAVRGLMLARAGVEPERIIDLVKEQVKKEGLARAEIVREIKEIKMFLGSGKVFKDAKYKELQNKWESLKATPGKGATALKENRLSLLVATLEIINLTKIAWEFKNDKRTYGELAAAACSTIAAIADIGANSAKHLVGDKVSITFQKLKVFGGIMSAGAGYYAAVQDWDGAKKALSKESYAISVAYTAKFVTQFSSSTFSLLASLSYAAPLLEASGNKAAQWAGARLLFYRLVSMTWALRLNMVGLAITVLIWALTPNPLKEWCKESPFGPNKNKGPKDSKVLMENLASALQEIS